MTSELSFTIKIDDSQLNAAQAKADKLVETLKQAEKLLRSLATPTTTFHFDSYKPAPETNKFKIGLGEAQWTINR